MSLNGEYQNCWNNANCLNKMDADQHENMNKIRQFLERYGKFESKKTLKPPPVAAVPEKKPDFKKEISILEEQAEQARTEEAKVESRAAEMSQEKQMMQQKKLKTFIDGEISSKIRSVVKEQVMKLFTDYVSKREQQDLSEEKEFENIQMTTLKNEVEQLRQKLQKDQQQ
jgi:hypothetical protein